jgi:hypothetical protein
MLDLDPDPQSITQKISEMLDLDSDPQSTTLNISKMLALGIRIRNPQH